MAGAGFLVVFILTLKGSWETGDYLTLVVLFALGILFFVSGILIKRWAKRNGKNKQYRRMRECGIIIEVGKHLLKQ